MTKSLEISRERTIDCNNRFVGKTVARRSSTKNNSNIYQETGPFLVIQINYLFRRVELVLARYRLVSKFTKRGKYRGYSLKRSVLIRLIKVCIAVTLTKFLCSIIITLTLSLRAEKYPIMARRAIAEACRTREDWTELREIFTRSFKKYPLFEHVIPNQQKRLEFVRKFIDANYAVHAADKSALPLLIRKMTGIQTENQSVVLTSENRLQQIVKTKMETFGGVLFIKPAKDGIGWSTNPNEVYVRSYMKHGLHEIDAEAFERLKTYEEWETENITDDIFSMKVPMWNGMLCAIDPKYAGNGVGCEAFAECMKYLDKHNSISADCKDKKATNGSKCESKEEGRYTRLSIQSRNDTSENHNSYDSFATKILRNLSLITHHPHHAFSLNTALSNSSQSLTSQRQHKEKSPRKTSSTPSTCQPLIALSHCPRAVQFHTRNGFRCIRKLPYYPPGDENPAFDVYVLMTDVNKYL